MKCVIVNAILLPHGTREGNGKGWQIAGLRANFLAPKSGAGPLSRFSIPNLFAARRAIMCEHYSD